MIKRVKHGLFRNRAIKATSDRHIAVERPLSSNVAMLEGIARESNACASCGKALIGLQSAFSDGGCGHVFHKACASKLSRCPICLEPFSPVKEASRQGQRHSTFRTNTVGKEENSNLKQGAALPGLLALDVNLCSTCHTLGPGASDMRLLLQLQPYFPEAALTRIRGHLNLAIIIDISSTKMSDKHFTASKVLCEAFLSHLIPGDSYVLLTTVQNADMRDERPLSRISATTPRDAQAFLESITLDGLNHESDVVKTVQHSTQLLGKCLEGKSCVVLISDSSAPPDKLQSKRLSRCFRDSGAAFLCLGLGITHESSSSRKWSQTCEEGLYSDARQPFDIQRIFEDFRRDCLMMPLTNVKLDLELRDGATITSVAEDHCTKAHQSPHCLSLALDRISPYELCQVMLKVRVPPLSRNTTSSPVTPHRQRADCARRLAELEDMVQMLPFTLATCAVSFNHPAMQSGIRLTLEEMVLTMKRGPQTQVDTDILKCTVKGEALDLLRQAQATEHKHQHAAALDLLRNAERIVYNSCNEHDLAISDFEELLSELSRLRSRVLLQSRTTSGSRLSAAQGMQNSRPSSVQSSHVKEYSQLWEQVALSLPKETTVHEAQRTRKIPEKNGLLPGRALSDQLPECEPSVSPARVHNSAGPDVVRSRSRLSRDKTHGRPRDRDITTRSALSNMTDSRSYRMNAQDDDPFTSPLHRLEVQAQNLRRRPPTLPSTFDIDKLIRRSSQPNEQTPKSASMPPTLPSPTGQVRSYIYNKANIRQSPRSRPDVLQRAVSGGDPARTIWRMQQAERGEELSLSEANITEPQLTLSFQSLASLQLDAPLPIGLFQDPETLSSVHSSLLRGYDGRLAKANPPSPRNSFDSVQDKKTRQ